MIGPYFYHEITRKISIAFGSLFNDISIQRLDNNGVVVDTIEVPLSYGPHQAYLTRLQQDKSLLGVDTGIQMVLPRIAYDLIGITYDSSRKLQSGIKLRNCSDPSSSAYSYNRVPFIWDFDLAIMTKNMDDMLQIAEQILPFFTPTLTVTIKDLEELGVATDIKIELTGVTLEDTYESAFDDLRALTWVLSFAVKGYLYPAVSNSGGIIETSIANIIAESTAVGTGGISTITCLSQPPIGAVYTKTDITPTEQVVVDSFSVSEVKNAKYFVTVQESDNTDVQSYELIASHSNGILPVFNKYSVVGDSISHTITVDIVDGVFRVLITNNELHRITVRTTKIETVVA
ncbi:MAG: hypothetical protein BV459_00370 [Thermoplasmata archaeon M11B2D]|nr:MAG: hypothetical protein BV459_00370 [Thermoplasmata archaeon M11B2D]